MRISSKLLRTMDLAIWLMMLSACAAPAGKALPLQDTHPSTSQPIPLQPVPQAAYVQLPLHPGWLDGQLAYYITTDVSDQKLAESAGANYVPRLVNTIPVAGDSKHSALERIYAVTNFKQAKILPSIPVPTGYRNEQTAYSPLWQMYYVTWREGSKPHELRSEEAVLDAEEQGFITLTRTDIISNCPVIYSKSGGLLSGVNIVSGMH